MSEIIERGAEAMRAKRRELINQPLDRIWPDLMRAAVEAMREPTKAMIGAALFAVPAHSSARDADRALYCAMIDVALATPPQSEDAA